MTQTPTVFTRDKSITAYELKQVKELFRTLELYQDIFIQALEDVSGCNEDCPSLEDDEICSCEADHNRAMRPLTLMPELQVRILRMIET